MTKITVKPNCSLLIDGEVELFDATGSKFDLGGREKISLCRCGHSNDKPFCDGSHKHHGFISEVVAKALPPKLQQ